MLSLEGPGVRVHLKGKNTEKRHSVLDANMEDKVLSGNLGKETKKLESFTLEEYANSLEFQQGALDDLNVAARRLEGVKLHNLVHDYREHSKHDMGYVM